MLSSFMSSFSKMSCERNKKSTGKIILGNFRMFRLLNCTNCLSDYLQTATSAIFHDDAYIRRIGAGSDESVQIIVSQIAHLEKRSSICTTWSEKLALDGKIAFTLDCFWLAGTSTCANSSLTFYWSTCPVRI